MENPKTYNDTELIKTLYNLKQFCNGTVKTEIGRVFITYYEKSKRLIQEYAVENNSRYFLEKLQELPQLTEQDAASFMNNDNHGPVITSGAGALSGLAGPIGIFVMALLGLLSYFKPSSNNTITTKDKVKQIEDTIDNLVYMINHPGFEELYYAKMEKNRAIEKSKLKGHGDV